jgi:hypothetical protein
VVPQTVEEGFGVSVQALVPLHDLIMQSVSVQVIGVPWQTLAPQTSL